MNNIGGDAKKIEVFPVEKDTVVDGMRQRMYVAEEREVSVLGW